MYAAAAIVCSEDCAVGYDPAGIHMLTACGVLSL